MKIKNQWIMSALSVILIGSQGALAYVPPQDRCVDLKTVTVVLPIENPLFSKSLFTKYVPTNLTPGNNGTLVLTQFQTGVQSRITQSVSDMIFNSEQVKKSSVMKLSSDIEKVAQKSVSISSSNGVTHKFSMALKANTRQAVMNYEGFFTSALTYSADQNNMTWVVAKPLDKTTTVSLTNTTSAGQFNPTSTLSLSHSF